MAHEKKITKVKSDVKTKPVKVESTALMKQYIDAAWLRLAGISVSEVATRLSRGNGVPSDSDKSISDAIHLLVSKIDQFRPMVLWSGKDASPYRNRNVAWQGRLMKIADLVTKDSRPVYLIDAVNKILKAESRRRIDDLKSSIQSLVDAQKAKTDLTPEELSRLSSVRLQIKEIKECYVCTPLILSKYLHLQYQEGMKMEDLARKMEPSVIAKFIIEHDGVQWEYLPVKMDAKTYSVRIDEKSSWTSADVRKHLEMPYACPSVITIKNDKNVLADVQNDIKVIDEYIAWYTSSGKIDFSEDYRLKYDSYRKRLRTLDLSVDTFKQKDGDMKVQNVTPEVSQPTQTVSSPRPAVTPASLPQSVTPDEILKYIYSFTNEGKQGLPIPKWIRDKYQAAAERLANVPNGARIFADLKAKNKGEQYYGTVANEIVKAAQTISQ